MKASGGVGKSGESDLEEGVSTYRACCENDLEKGVSRQTRSTNAGLLIMSQPIENDLKKGVSQTRAHNQ